jgi:hypothetical protein
MLFPHPQYRTPLYPPHDKTKTAVKQTHSSPTFTQITPLNKQAKEKGARKASKVLKTKKKNKTKKKQKRLFYEPYVT